MIGGKCRILKEDIVKDKGTAIRLIKVIKNTEDIYTTKKPYVVEATPLFKDGKIDTESWGCFGGSVGFDTSIFKTFKEANKFYNDFKELSLETLQKLYSNLIAL